MFNIITDPNFWFLVGVYWIFNAAVGAMPEPLPNSRGYEFLYKFLHTLAGNVQKAFAMKIPGEEKHDR
jgi:hypothetical protein